MFGRDGSLASCARVWGGLSKELLRGVSKLTRGNVNEQGLFNTKLQTSHKTKQNFQPRLESYFLIFWSCELTVLSCEPTLVLLGCPHPTEGSYSELYEQIALWGGTQRVLSNQWKQSANRGNRSLPQTDQFENNNYVQDF